MICNINYAVAATTLVMQRQLQTVLVTIAILVLCNGQDDTCNNNDIRLVSAVTDAEI